jgi:peptidyl-prolyl cis-trans isomerase C
MTVKARIRRGGAAAALVALLAFPAFPQATLAAEPAPDTVVARVDGNAITQADLTQAELDFRDQLAQVPADQRRSELIQHLIDTKLSARAAEAEGLDKKPEVQQRLQTVRERTLQLEYVRTTVMAAVTDQALHERYDNVVKSFVPTEQYQAAHILVKTEDEAKAIIAELDKGGDFAAIAKAKSQDPGSAPNGGELGFFDPAQMVKPFGDAVKAMKVGTYTEKPVQTQFGWHVIKLEATRKEPAPSFEQVAPQLRQQMISELFTKAMQDLRSKAKIEIVPAPATTDGTAAPATPAPAAPATPAPAK